MSTEIQDLNKTTGTNCIDALIYHGDVYQEILQQEFNPNYSSNERQKQVAARLKYKAEQSRIEREVKQAKAEGYDTTVPQAKRTLLVFDFPRDNPTTDQTIRALELMVMTPETTINGYTAWLARKACENVTGGYMRDLCCKVQEWYGLSKPGLN